MLLSAALYATPPVFPIPNTGLWDDTVFHLLGRHVDSTSASIYSFAVSVLHDALFTNEFAQPSQLYYLFLLCDVSFDNLIAASCDGLSLIDASSLSLAFRFSVSLVWNQFVCSPDASEFLLRPNLPPMIEDLLNGLVRGTCIPICSFFLDHCDIVVSDLLSRRWLHPWWVSFEMTLLGTSSGSVASSVSLPIQFDVLDILYLQSVYKCLVCTEQYSCREKKEAIKKIGYYPEIYTICYMHGLLRFRPQLSYSPDEDRLSWGDAIMWRRGLKVFLGGTLTPMPMSSSFQGISECGLYYLSEFHNGMSSNPAASDLCLYLSAIVDAVRFNVSVLVRYGRSGCPIFYYYSRYWMFEIIGEGTDQTCFGTSLAYGSKQLSEYLEGVDVMAACQMFLVCFHECPIDSVMDSLMYSSIPPTPYRDGKSNIFAKVDGASLLGEECQYILQVVRDEIISIYRSNIDLLSSRLPPTILQWVRGYICTGQLDTYAYDKSFVLCNRGGGDYACSGWRMIFSYHLREFLDGQSNLIRYGSLVSEMGPFRMLLSACGYFSDEMQCLSLTPSPSIGYPSLCIASDDCALVTIESVPFLPYYHPEFIKSSW